MKNIAVLSFLVIILNSAYCQETLTAEAPKTVKEKEKNYRFALGTHFGFVYGQALEYVYPTNTKGEFLSELKWDMKPVFYLGANADFSLIDIMKSPGFFASLSFNGGIPSGDSGVMEDRDWRSVENAALTNFSSHTNLTREFFMLEASVGASIPVKTWFYIKPFLSASLTRFSFEGRNGYYKYAKDKYGNPATDSTTEFSSIDDNPTTGPINGVIILYTQDWFLLAAGLSVGTKIISPFFFELSFQISPLTFCADKDVHIKSDTWLDYPNMGLFLEPRGSVSFTVKNIEISLDLSYRRIGKTRGKSYKELREGDYMLSPNEAGTGLSLFSSRFLVKLLLD